MPRKKPLNDAELEAFEDSLDFDALLLKSAGEMAARRIAVVHGPAIEVVMPEGASGAPVTGRRRNVRAAPGTKPPGKAIRSTTVPR